MIGYATHGLILIVAPFLAVFYYFLQRKYRRSSRELKRLDSVSRSPVCVAGCQPCGVPRRSRTGAHSPLAMSLSRRRASRLCRDLRYAHFSECVTGVTVIRAFGAQEAEVAACQRYLTCNQRACFVSNAGTQWLALRLQV